MFEIIESKEFISKDTSLKDLGLAFDAAHKLRFQARPGFERSIFEIKEWLEANFKMYQYKKDNGVKYGEHELFYWHRDGDDRYFTVDIKYKDIRADRNAASEILCYIATAHKNVDGYVVLQFKTIPSWADINRFIMDMDISDTEKLPLNAIAVIANESYYTGDTLTLDSRAKLSKLETDLLGAMRDKKVRFSDSVGRPIMGTLRQLSNGGFALFKPRATKTFYPMSLRNIANLHVA